MSLQGSSPSGGSRGNSFFLSFQVTGVCLHSLAHSPASNLIMLASASVTASPPTTDALESIFHLEVHSGSHCTHLDDPRLSPHLKILRLMTSAKSLLKSQVAYSQTVPPTPPIPQL